MSLAMYTRRELLTYRPVLFRHGFVCSNMSRLTRTRLSVLCVRQGFSFCDGSGGGTQCKGACHLYTSSSSPGLGAGWQFNKGQGGDPHKISKLAPGTWWHCYSKSSVAEIGKVQLYHAHDGDITAPELMGPVKSNVSSGIIGMTFVEVCVTRVSFLCSCVTATNLRRQFIHVLLPGCAHSYCRPQPSSSAKDCIVRFQYRYRRQRREHGVTK